MMTFGAQGLPGKVRFSYLIICFETCVCQECSWISASLCSGIKTSCFLPSLNLFLFKAQLRLSLLFLANISPAFLSQVYKECSCIEKNTFPGEAEAGKCTSSCEKRTLLLFFMFIVILFTFLSSIPALTATLR